MTNYFLDISHAVENKPVAPPPFEEMAPLVLPSQVMAPSLVLPSQVMAPSLVLPSQVMAPSLVPPLVALVGPEGGQINMGEDLLELHTITTYYNAELRVSGQMN